MKTFGRADDSCSPRTPFEPGVVERYATPTPHPVARVLPAVVCGLGLVWGVVALMPMPRPVAVGMLVTLALVGLALGRRQ